MKLGRSTKWWLGAVVVVQVVVYVLAGIGKSYIHMDEAYSLALTQYDKIDITENPDFYNTWHTDEYYQDYLAIQGKDRGDFSPVYENQKNDVHPPLYYALLRCVQGMSGERFSKWPGIVLNIAIMAGNTVLLFAVVRKVVQKTEKADIKALIVTFAAGVTVAGISTVVYIRMYALLTLMVMLTLWLHLKLQEEKEMKWYVLIALVAVLGTLTQYYYLFFLAGLAMVVLVDGIRQKKWRELGTYFGSLGVAGVVVLMVWPHILQHMFFGYRGQGVISNLLNPIKLVQHLWEYVLIVDYNVFHRLLLPIIVVMIGLGVYRLVKKRERVRLPREFWWMLWPTVSYFVLAVVASPFMELRYIMPVCGLIFVLVMYGLYKVMTGVANGKLRKGVMLGVITVVLVAAPVQISLGWMRIELLYRDRREVMRAVEENLQAPILYFITTENNRFLDNILPFAEAKESYLALDLKEPTERTVKEILAGKDLSAGLLVFVSSEQDQERTLEVVEAATGLKESRWVQGINTCDVYMLTK